MFICTVYSRRLWLQSLILQWTLIDYTERDTKQLSRIVDAIHAHTYFHGDSHADAITDHQNGARRITTWLKNAHHHGSDCEIIDTGYISNFRLSLLEVLWRVCSSEWIHRYQIASNTTSLSAMNLSTRLDYFPEFQLELAVQTTVSVCGSIPGVIINSGHTVGGQFKHWLKTRIFFFISVWGFA